MQQEKAQQKSINFLKLNCCRQRYEILYFTDEIDEFAIKVLMNYKEKEFKNVSSADMDLKTNENENDENKKKTRTFLNS